MEYPTTLLPQFHSNTYTHTPPRTPNLLHERQSTSPPISSSSWPQVSTLVRVSNPLRLPTPPSRAMRVHPAPRKRTIAVERCAAAAAAAAGGKKLRRLPHIFAKVLELPFAADADVTVEEDAAALRFVAAADGFTPGGTRAHAVEIHPGVTKVVVRDLAASGEDGDAALDLDRWRFRLPPCTRPAMATATYAEGELVVTVPKGALPDDDATAVLGAAATTKTVLVLV